MSITREGHERDMAERERLLSHPTVRSAIAAAESARDKLQAERDAAVALLARAIHYVEAEIISLENEVDHEYDHTEAQRSIAKNIADANGLLAELQAFPLQPSVETKDLPDSPGMWRRNGVWWVVEFQEGVCMGGCEVKPSGHREWRGFNSGQFPRGDWQRPQVAATSMPLNQDELSQLKQAAARLLDCESPSYWLADEGYPPFRNDAMLVAHAIRTAIAHQLPPELPAQSAIETLIARYRALNGHVASDGYEDRDEDQIVAAAEAQLTALREQQEKLAGENESLKRQIETLTAKGT